MLKDILVECAQLLDRSDMLDELKTAKSVDEIEDLQVQRDVIKLISYYNFITELIYENYIDLIREDIFISGADRKIFYSNFIFKPIKIISAVSSENPEYFQILSDCIIVSKPNIKYKIEYKYLPDAIYDFDKDICIQGLVSKNILSTGIISQFLASKGKYNESEYWNDKFMLSLFKLKTKKGRRLKPHFKI